MKSFFIRLELLGVTILIIMSFSCKSNDTKEYEEDVVTDVAGDTLDETIVTQVISDEIDIKNAVRGCVSYNFSREYFLKDSLFDLHYEINLALPTEVPEWFMRFMNDYTHKELSAVFFGDKIKPRLFKIDSSTSWDDIGKHYFTWMKKNYKKEFPQKSDEDKYLGADYEFKLTVYPIWENKDYITYQIYAYELPGSMRSRERDFCRTFEKTSGRVLGIRDFYSEAEFKEAVALLEQQLGSSIKIEGVTADVNPENNVFASADMVLKERYNGKLYPHPAITSEEIVFTYQTYEKGSGGHGILKFTIPYDSTSRILNSK